MIVLACVILSSVGSVSAIVGFTDNNLQHTALSVLCFWMLGCFMGAHWSKGK
jgi:hypothetical protein